MNSSTLASGSTPFSSPVDSRFGGTSGAAALLEGVSPHNLSGVEFGRYRLETLLGQGGMGQVYKAFDRSTNRMVALKLLPEHLIADRRYRERFLREANVVAGLADPHVIPIHGFGEIDGRLYLDMRLVEGEDVQSLIERCGTLGPAETVAIVEQVASALDSAHRIGLVHRDVKPSNVLVTPDGFAYLIDFGIARADGEAGLTSTGGVVGTLAYMAPERFSTGIADSRSDVYSLACILVQCLTGATPFPGKSLEQQLAGHLSQPPPRPSTTVPGVPAAFDDVVARGMAKDPAQRYQSTPELAAAARDALGGNAAEPTTVVTAGPPVFGASLGNPPAVHDVPPPPTQPALHLQPTMHRPPFPPGAGQRPHPQRENGRTMAAFGAVAAVLLIVVSVVAVAFWGRDGGDGQTAGRSTTSRSGSDGTSDGGGLAIVPAAQIDIEGVEIVWDPTDVLDPAGDQGATCPPLSIAMAGAITGPDAALGNNIENGARFAVDTHNAANPGCRVDLKVFDTEGDPAKATAVAHRVIADPSVIGVVGPAFSGETKATGGLFDAAGLATVTPSATNPTLSQDGFRTFFRGLASDEVLNPALANYLTNALKARKVCLVNDSTDYALGLVETVRNVLGRVVEPSCDIAFRKGTRNFSAAISQIEKVSPDAVFFGGYYSDAAPFVKQLREAGVDATFVSADGVKDAEFVDAAGDASAGTVLGCACGPASPSFSERYSSATGWVPGTYTVEAYDLASIMLRGIDSGSHSREAMLSFLRGYSGDGVARHYQWGPTGELTEQRVWLYTVK